jgi:hypothetical protein
MRKLFPLGSVLIVAVITLILAPSQAVAQDPMAVAPPISRCSSRNEHVSADGKTQEADSKAGDVRWTPAGAHSTEGLSDTKAILVELKKKQ